MKKEIFKEKLSDNVTNVIKFDKYYKIFFKDKTTIVISENNLDKYSLSSNKFDYFKEISKIVSVKTEDGIGILTKEYEKINFIEKDTALYKYLNPMYKNSEISKSSLDEISELPHICIPCSSDTKRLSTETKAKSKNRKRERK